MSNQPATEIMIEGRTVCGHPMVRRIVKRKLPGATVETVVIDPATNIAVTEAYFAIAIPKIAGQDWKQTLWGQQMHARGVQDWPNGEHGAPAFAWKIVDGDSAVPNTKQKKPCDREGWPGHWIIHCSTQFAIRCHHVGQYDPSQQIQVEAEIKTGDYARVLIGVKGNGPSQSPGIYVNPILYELSRAGVAIISEGGPAAADVFGAAAPNVPANAAVDTSIAPAQHVAANGAVIAPPPNGPGTAVAPAPDFLAPKMYIHNGQQYTEESLIAGGWNPQQIAGLPTA